MPSHSRTIFISLTLVLLGLIALRASTTRSALAGADAGVKLSSSGYTSNFLFLPTTLSATAAKPNILEDKADRAYTVVQTKRMEARLKLIPGRASEGRFQITLSSTLPISDVLAPINLSWQHGGQAMTNLLSKPAIQGNGWAVVTGTLQPSQTEWLLTVQNLATDPSVRLQISMTSQQGTITSVKVDPLVQVTQTTYFVTTPLPSSVRLSGYALRTVFPPSSKPACEGMAMTWRVADGQNTMAPGLSETITKSTTLSKVGAICIAESSVSLTGVIASGRYTYTLQADWEGFSNQAQAVLAVVNPPTPTFTPTPTWTDTPIPTPTSTDTLIPTPTSTDTSIPTPTPTDTSIPTPTSTDTPIPTPTSTDTPIPTSTSTDTRRPTPTSTDTPIPTPTSTDTRRPTPTPTETETYIPTPDFYDQCRRRCNGNQICLFKCEVEEMCRQHPELPECNNFDPFPR